MSPIATPFGFASTAAEAAAGVDLTGRRAVVTGASSGIGVETARTLAANGAEVVLAVRDVAAGERTVKDIAATTGNRALQSYRWISRTRLRLPRSRPPGTVRCTCS